MKRREKPEPPVPAPTASDAYFRASHQRMFGLCTGVDGDTPATAPTDIDSLAVADILSTPAGISATAYHRFKET